MEISATFWENAHHRRIIYCHYVLSGPHERHHFYYRSCDSMLSRRRNSFASYSSKLSLSSLPSSQRNERDILVLVFLIKVLMFSMDFWTWTWLSDFHFHFWIFGVSTICSIVIKTVWTIRSIFFLKNSLF